MDFSKDGKMIVSCSKTGSIKTWNAESGKLIKTFSGHTDSVLEAHFFPDGSKILSCSKDSSVKVWNTKTTKVLFSETIDNDAGFTSAVAISDDGEHIALGGNDLIVKYA